MMEMLSMGKYSWHVWGSFVLTFAVVFVCTWQCRRRHRDVLDDIGRRTRAMEAES